MTVLLLCLMACQVTGGTMHEWVGVGMTILLIDSWADQAAIDAHHASPMMATITALREKYDLHMTVERHVSMK